MGEIGKYPVAFYYYCRCIKYWLEIIRIPDHIYPKVCYSMLKVLNERCRITWASRIRYLLEKYGFSFVWISQGVGYVGLDNIYGILYLKQSYRNILRISSLPTLEI